MARTLALFAWAAFAAGCGVHGPSSGPGSADGGTGASGDDFQTDCPALFTATPAAPTSPCQVSPTQVTCPARTLSMNDGVESRNVHFELPTGTAPAAGWPTVLAYQGSFISSSEFFSASASDAFGAYAEALTVSELLAAGFAVIAPDTDDGGSTFWDTNIPPWDLSWTGSPDDVFLQVLFSAMRGGQLGPLDMGSLYAMGISSGGYMTSRMAVSYQGQFKALAIESASYATCAGAVCAVPSLPSNHPPTLFLHGLMDTIVPIATMQKYRSALQGEGISTCEIVDQLAGHEWIPEAPGPVVAWFQQNP
jgi:poly(3-hydroxybutyrate) depolymerase